ncbi:MAG: PEP/pyruvate-binding domain-containing protein [Lachnospiraceae bacterium]
MAAFDKVQCGCPRIDQILDHIRLGDNVVWQVSDIEDYRFFAQIFARRAVLDGRKLIYIRFAKHEPVLQNLRGVKVYEFDPDQGFEAFTVAIYNKITEEGREACYVFDCLSELQSAWYTDLMMGNFFRVTCPYLFEMDTVAYFPLIRGQHSFDAVSRIRDTTQVLVDVYTKDNLVYLHPLKVWNRHSGQMFLPHLGTKRACDFQVVEDGIQMSQYYHMVQDVEMNTQDQNYDSHERFFTSAKMEYAWGQFRLETEDLIIQSCMTKDKRLVELLKKYFKPEDYFRLWNRMIGSGAIGGKACGMLLARKITEAEIPEYQQYSEPHDSYYIGSDVFYTYVVANDCWKLRIRQRTKEGYFKAADELKERFLKGSFMPKLKEQFRNMLDYFGQNPIIVRSSSFLEDGFGNAFAGKYESVFCVNQGSPEERLEDFEQAVRQVYASTMDISALEYRRQRGLHDKDEQMAILVQRVSGSRYGRYFMPGAAGVGYSHSAYKWRPDMDPAAGMLRIVMGLGTKAVDRTEQDYPRLANLDCPATTMLTTVAQKHRFSQRRIDVLDYETNTLHDVELEKLLPELPRWYKNQVLDRDDEAEDRLRQMGRFREVWFVTCQKLLEQKAFTELMQKVLKTLEKVYQNPVDIEYTVNLGPDGDFAVNLLQCRPLYIGKQGGHVSLPDLAEADIFFHISDSSMGPSQKQTIDAVVQVDPVAYYNYPYAKKCDVATAIGRINQHYRQSGKKVLLMSPGRIGTSSPELGVPVAFAQISNFSGICEVSDDRAGYMPELSYGSHMFQDLAEAEIFYGAIWNNEKTMVYHPDLFRNEENLFGGMCPEMPELADMIQVSEPEHLCYWLDAVSNQGICGFDKEQNS